MPPRAVIFGISSVLFAAVPAMLPANPAAQIVGRTMYHPDKSRTESVRNPDLRTLEERTYDANNVMTVRKEFLLNERGEPLQGNIYDGRDNLVARCQSRYDQFGRRVEDRLMNMRGEVFQQVIHEYGADGKAMKPKVINLNPAPSLKPGVIDFTQGTGGATTLQPGTAPATAAPDAAGQPPALAGQDRFAPAPAAGAQGAPPMAPPAADGSGGLGVAPVAPPSQEKPKANFFKRLFGKDKEKGK